MVVGRLAGWQVAMFTSWRRVAVASIVATSFLLMIFMLGGRDYLLVSSSTLPSSFLGSESGPESGDGERSPSHDNNNNNNNNDGNKDDVGRQGGGGGGGGAGGGANNNNKNQDHQVELVVASIKKEDTTWFHAYLPDWHKNIYVADDPSAPLTVPENKGREAMVYLTYIIDRYEDLPQAVLFLHASRFAWHNDDPDYDALPTLLDFRLPYLRRQGYVNLRCVWVIGCPREIRPAEDAAKKDEAEELMAKHVYKESFEALLPGVPVPELVAVSCCSQFGVTRETIRRRPLTDYIHFRNWLLETPLDDALNGRIFEFAWHIIFGKEAMHCPLAADCYCNVFGHCNMTCTESSCEGRYNLPYYSTLPPDWPTVGWDGEERNFTGPL
ncbi:hypothetical protein GGS20DRAFT_197195 [Poronia punctata]|nr:hypothetical protein GGS20DRAFT_197195 [Poronia punctata]